MTRKFESIADNPHSKPFYFKGSSTGVLLLHGFTGTPGTMKKIGEDLHKIGYTVHCPLLPGHGTHITDMENSNWLQWLDASRNAAAHLNEKCDDIIICGLSMGGLLILILASEVNPKNAISIAAPIELTDPLAKFSWLFKYFVRYRGSGRRDASEHPYKVGYAATPIRKVPDLLKLIKLAKSRLSSISCPLLVVRALKDTTVKKSAAQLIFNGAKNSARREIFDLENSVHLCTVDNEADILVDKIKSFISV